MNLQKCICVFWRSHFVSWILGFGFGDVVKKISEKKTEKQPKRKNKYIAYRGLILYYHRGEGLPRGNSGNFFSLLLKVVPDFQETNVYEPNFATFFW